MSGPASRPGRFPQRKKSPVPIGYEAGWAPEPVWTLKSREKYFASGGNRTPVVQPLARRYTDELSRLLSRGNIVAFNWRDRGKQGITGVPARIQTDLLVDTSQQRQAVPPCSVFRQ
jgi:hypothetical protein